MNPATSNIQINYLREYNEHASKSLQLTRCSNDVMWHLQYLIVSILLVKFGKHQKTIIAAHKDGRDC